MNVEQNQTELANQQLADLAELVRVAHVNPSEGIHGDHKHGQTREAVVDRLYRAYTNHSSLDGKGLRPVRDPAGQARFVATLSLANTSRWSWLDGCEVQGIEDSQFIVRAADGSVRRVHPLSFDGPTASGHGKLLQEKEHAEGGAWYFAFGEDTFSAAKERTIRLYWSLCSDGAPAFVNRATTLLNKNRIPFALKVLKDPAQYGRGDGGVLYLPRYVWDRASAIVRDLHAEIEPYLQDRTPRLTKRLARGLGLAEDPGGGDSFGMTRSRMIADILAAHGGDASDPQAFLVEELGKRGYPPGRLHLCDSTKRDFRLDDYATEAKVEK